MSILAALKDTVPNMPGLKWIFNPVLAKGEHAVKLTPEEESKRTADDDTDTVTDEQDTVDDELMDPRAVQALPEMAPGGGTKLTKFQKLQALSDDRARVRKAFESAGGSSNKHFAIDCSLYHSTQRGAPNYRWNRVLLFVLKSPFKSDANAPRKLAESQGMAAHHGAQSRRFQEVPLFLICSY